MFKYLVSIICLSLLVSVSGQDWHWELNDELLNPYHIYTEGMNTPFTGDFDNDGDIDLIVGCRGGILQYYENIGTPDGAIWQQDEDYFSGIEIDTSYAPQPSLVDLDGDGMDELYLSFVDGTYGEPVGSLTRFLNEGSNDNPLWVAAEFDIGYDLQNSHSQQFVDYDGDADYDLLMTNDLAPVLYRNVGDSMNYAFEIDNAIFENIDLIPGYEASSRLVDFDQNGIYEFVYSVDEIDCYDLSMTMLFNNQGSVDNPIWVPSSFSYYNKCCTELTFADMDNDNDLDMLAGNHWIPLFYNENTSAGGDPVFRFSYDGLRWGRPYCYVGDNICFVDYNNDNYQDLVYSYRVTTWNTDEWLVEGSAINSTSTGPVYLDYMQGFFNAPLYSVWRDLQLSDGDLNGDGFPELAFGSSWPCYYQNLDGAGYSYDTYSTLLVDDSTYNQYPELADYNDDGLTDLLVKREHIHDWMFFKNTGDQWSPAWSRMPQWANGIEHNLVKIRAANLNRDDWPDLVGIDQSNHLYGYINIGSGEDAAFSYNADIFAGWEDYSAYYYDFADLDNDGDDDLLVDSSGRIMLIENETTVGIADNNESLPENVNLLQNYPNPFNSSTNISFNLNKTDYVTLVVYDILGRKLETLYEGTLAAGKHTINWRAQEGLSSGIYFCRLKTGAGTVTRQMAYVK